MTLKLSVIHLLLAMASEGAGDLRLVNRLDESRSPYVSRQYVDAKLAFSYSSGADLSYMKGSRACRQPSGMANLGGREPSFGKETQPAAVRQHRLRRLSL